MTGSLYVAQTGLKFGGFLLLPLEYYNCSGPLESVTNTFFAKSKHTSTNTFSCTTGFSYLKYLLRHQKVHIGAESY